ncbi:MAG: PIN domain-containing protein [Spirochaetales bacterium]|nr:PIN domain-containing protein [Spirochaetales bacterium]
MRTLVDTSVWIDHFRNTNKQLISLLNNNDVKIHPYILGELSCGNFKNRKKIFSYLNSLSICTIATHDEALFFLEKHALYGKGLGWIDIHLLASCILSKAKLFTLDKRLAQTAGMILDY